MKCYICGETFDKAKYGRNRLVEIFMFLISIPLFFIPLIIYYIATPRWRCPYCGNKIIKI